MDKVNIPEEIRNYKKNNPLMSNNKIALKLGVSPQYVGKIVNIGKVYPKPISKNNIGLPLNKKEVYPKQELVYPKPKLNQPEEQKESVADLKIKFNSILKEIYNKIRVSQEDIKKLQDNQKVIELKQNTLKDEMSDEFSHRVNKVIGYSLKSHIERMREDLFRQCREEIKTQTKAR